MSAKRPPSGPTAAEVCAQTELPDDVRGLLREGMMPEAFVQDLRERKLYREALGFVAHWLSARKAIWWGCECLWEVYRPAPPAPVDAGLGAIVRWVLKPVEENRRAVGALVEDLGLETPIGSLAYAAFASHGSLIPPGLPEVAAPPGLAAQIVASALLLAAAVDPARTLECYHTFLTVASTVADDRNLWS